MYYKIFNRQLYDTGSQCPFRGLTSEQIFSNERSSIEQIDGVDTDLVFDSLEQSNSNNENHHRKQKHNRIGHENDPPLVQEQEEESHWLSGTVNRIKRSISSLFSKGEDQSKQHHIKQEKREADHGKHEKKEEKDDDEDALDVQSGRGSGEIDSSTSDFPVTFPHSHPRVYRFAVTIMEPYMEAYEDRNSPAFQDLARRIKRSFEQTFENVPDVDSTGYSEAEGIRSAIYEKISKDHRVGNLTVIPENFSFREFGASHPRCDQNHMQCLSGECVPADSRCDGKQDCPDNSDEEGCRDREGGTSEEIIPHTTSSSPAYFPRTEEPEVEGSGDEGNCRADDGERCADGSRIICADQKCDGHPDCDDGGDERDCPSRECAVGEFKCDIRRCIPVDQLCDGKPDCSDLSDEQNCQRQCTSDEFRCNTGQCIPLRQQCDGAAQCSDNSDEVNCQSKSAWFLFLFRFFSVGSN
nr:unnamed protein product [Callosobruchus chinensis]